jgi:hypothetical protein
MLDMGLAALRTTVGLTIPCSRYPMLTEINSYAGANGRNAAAGAPSLPLTSLHLLCSKSTALKASNLRQRGRFSTRQLFGVLLPLAVGLASEMAAWAQFDDFEISLTPAARAYCHVVRFPQGWSTQNFDAKAPQHLFFGSTHSDYEFRVDGALGTKFLMAAFTELVGTIYYANNQYEVDLSYSTAPVTAIGRKTWETAAVVPLIRKSAFPPIGTVQSDKHLEFRGLQFNKTGDIWGQPSDYATRLSPDQAWLVLQSTSIGTKPGSTKVYFDFFNADTGKKLFTIDGLFSSIRGGEPEGSVLSKTGWVTERYFIVPLGKTIDRCLACDFGGRNHDKGIQQ